LTVVYYPQVWNQRILFPQTLQAITGKCEILACHRGDAEY